MKNPGFLDIARELLDTFERAKWREISNEEAADALLDPQKIPASGEYTADRANAEQALEEIAEEFSQRNYHPARKAIKISSEIKPELLAEVMGFIENVTRRLVKETGEEAYAPFSFIFSEGQDRILLMALFPERINFISIKRELERVVEQEKKKWRKVSDHYERPYVEGQDQRGFELDHYRTIAELYSRDHDAIWRIRRGDNDYLCMKQEVAEQYFQHELGISRGTDRPRS